MGTSEPIGCPQCGAYLEQVTRERNELLQRIEDVQTELAVKIGTIRRMRGEQVRKPEESPHYAEAMELLEYWRQLCAPKTRELKGPRLEKALARLNGGYDVANLKLAVFGYSRRPYVTIGGRSAKGLAMQRHVDAELIFRDAKHVDMGLAIAEDELERSPDLTALTPVERMQMRLGI